MLHGVVDFLKFSEENLSNQRAMEVLQAEREGESIRFDPPDEQLEDQYRSQLIQQAEYRFDVSLSRSIRYGGLVAFATSVELCAKTFEAGIVDPDLKEKVRQMPPNTSRHIFLLDRLNRLTSSGVAAEISDLQRLIFVRNCIVHASGLVERYAYEKEIEEMVKFLQGFSVWDEDFLGKSVRIEAGAVEKYARHAADWIPRLHERSAVAGILKA